jgi:DNA-3-methyladenine glycosylase I
MVKRQLQRISLGSLFFIIGAISIFAQPKTMVSGKVISKEKQEVVDFATVYLKGTTYGCTTNEEGIYHLHAPAGKYTLVVSAIGYKTIEKPVTLVHGERIKMNVMIDPSVTELGEVVVVSNGVSRVKRSAFNAIAVDTKEFQNSTKNLSDALAKAPGMKLRESGGVGSDMQLMLDGFSGKHVKIFIDGVPQEGVGSSFGLNNIPVNFADRIEVYKGVVPVGFGTDAIGGVINIVTNKKKRNWFLDGSYSYGSFNTHKSYVKYHDQEWGKLVTDDKTLFEFLVLESAQAGLSWITILRKREGYRKAFYNFDAELVAQMTDEDIERLMQFEGIVKNRLKIKSTITNAKLFLAVQKEFGSFYNYTLSFFPDKKPIINTFRSLSEIPVSSPESDAMSKDMKKRGFKFFGTTICYAHLQASGFINDHLTDCICRKVPQ